MGQIDNKDFIIKGDGTIVRNPNIKKKKNQIVGKKSDSSTSGNGKWIVLLLLAILGIGCYIAFNQNRDTDYDSDSNSYQMGSSYSSSQEESSSYSSDNQNLIPLGHSYSTSNPAERASSTDRDTEYENILSRRELTESDLAGKSNYELRKMVNRIYAHNGYIFSKEEWRNYFSQFSWYSPSTSDQSTVYNRFSSIERYNVDFIKNHEQ